jgi:hypothetical protein
MSLIAHGIEAFSIKTDSFQRVSALKAYVPSGLTAEQYRKIKEADTKKLGKNLGGLGPRGFKSRSLQAWQEAYEKGEATHYVAPIGYKKNLKQGKMKMQDVPYMLRPNGSWDDSDVVGAKKKTWSKTDKEYAKGGYKKEQSVSILGSGPGLDWTGNRPRENGPSRVYPGFF